MLHVWMIRQTDIVIKCGLLNCYLNTTEKQDTVLQIHKLKKYVSLYCVFFREESVYCIMDPGRQTEGCRPRLEVLNLGLGTLGG